ncbi:hypothetical protein D3C72_1289970 [compost metagenome]
MELHPIFVDPPDQRDHVFHRIGMAQRFKAHAAAGGIVHFIVLHMKARLRQPIQIARMIVVQMGQQHVLHVFGLHAKLRQCGNGTLDQLALARARHVGVEARVDQHDTALAAYQPHEEIHGHVAVVRVAAQEVVAPLARHAGVANGVYLVLGKRVLHRQARVKCPDRLSARRGRPTGRRPCRCAPPRRARTHRPDAPGAAPAARSAPPARWRCRCRG